MNHYKSWSELNKQLTERLCDSLKDRVKYFLTRYHKVHNAYGRASVNVDGKELVNFTWWDMYKQDYDVNELWKQTGQWDYNTEELKQKWDETATYSEMNFLDAATEFLQLSIKEALCSDNYLIRMFAIMDRRVGKRTLDAIKDSGEYMGYPEWLRQFYELRICNS